MNNRIKGALLAMTGGMSWGISGSVGQYLFETQGMDSRWLVPVRLGLAGIVMILYCAVRYGRRIFAPWSTRERAVRTLVYSIPGVALCQFFYFLTIQLSNAAVGTILQDLSPVMILVAVCVLARRKPRAYELAAIALALAGVFLLTTHGDLHSLVIPAPALAAGILSAVAVTVYNLVPGRMLQEIPVSVLQAWAFLLGGAVLAVCFRIWTIPVTMNLQKVLGIAAVVLIGNVIAFSTYIRGVSLIGAEKATLYGFAEPVTAAIIAQVVFRSPFTWQDAAGFALIFGMMALISFGGTGRERKERR